VNEPIVARHWLAIVAPKAAPAIATTTVLALARIWNANGAEHSVGNAALMTVLSAGAAFAGVAGYADGLPLPLLLWSLATAGAYALAARYWRTDRRETVAYERHMSDRREEYAHIERVETLHATAQIEVARTGAAYAEQLAAALVTRATLPGFDPTALEAAGLPELPTAERKFV